MTVLIIGGAYQGKLDYAKSLTGFDGTVADGGELDKEGFINGSTCVNRLHLFIRHLLEEGYKPYEINELILKNVSDRIFICDDICGGIVPADKDENHWRETTGRLLCELTVKADIVVRIQCGIAQALKGEALFANTQALKGEALC